MSRLEVVRVRLAGGPAEGLLAELRQALSAERASGSVRLYRSATVPTDLALHIGRRPAEEGDGPSELGLRLAAALREHGMVEHELWVESREEVIR